MIAVEGTPTQHADSRDNRKTSQEAQYAIHFTVGPRGLEFVCMYTHATKSTCVQDLSMARRDSRNGQRTVLDRAPHATTTRVGDIALDEPIHGQTHAVAGLIAAVLASHHAARDGALPKGFAHRFRVETHHRDVVSSSHEPFHFARLPVDVGRKDVNHVLLGIRGGAVDAAALAVRGHVEGSRPAVGVGGRVRVQHAEDVGRRRGVDHGAGDDLEHGFAAGRRGRDAGVGEQACAAAVGGAGEEGHAQGFGRGDLLQRADEVCAFEVLSWRL